MVSNSSKPLIWWIKNMIENQRPELVSPRRKWLRSHSFLICSSVTASMLLLLTYKKLCKKKKMSAILGQPIARVISKTEAVQNGESFVKRKPVKAKYSTLQHIGDCNKGGTHHSKTGKYQFWQIHFEATDYYVPSLKQRFDQPL